MKTDEYFFRVDRLSSQPFCIIMRQQESETLQVVLEVAYRTQESVSSEKSWKYDAHRSVFDETWGVWIVDETLSRVPKE